MRTWAATYRKTESGRAKRRLVKAAREKRKAAAREIIRAETRRIKNEARLAKTAKYWKWFAEQKIEWDRTRAERRTARDTRNKAARRAKKLKATPAWVDKNAIRAMYAGVRRWGWQVDHIVPLRSPIVCGLHVPANLQALSQEENCAKRNLHWPDMPDVL